MANADPDTGSDPVLRISAPKQRSTDDPRAPWWVGAAFRAFMILGPLGSLLVWREFKDYKLEERRMMVEEKRVSADERQNVLLERFEKVLWRVERKLPAETGDNR